MALRFVVMAVILRKIPYDGDFRAEAIKQRKHWVDLVQRKRVKWEPLRTSCISSKYFEPNASAAKVNLPGQKTTIHTVAEKNQLGVSSCTTLFGFGASETTTKKTTYWAFNTI